MATITVRIGDDTRVQLEDLARAQDRSLSDLIRSSLESLVRYPDRSRPHVDGASCDSVAPRSLSPYERQMLALQHRILAHVMPPDHGDAPTQDCAYVEGDPKYQRERAQILEGGYVGEYATVFISTEPEMPAHESEFVIDLLDMFRIITYSIQRLRGTGAEIDEALEQRLGFRGFDLQRKDESRLLTYLRHLVDDDHWPEILPLLGPDHDHGNAHHPTRPAYERLLTEYNAIRQEHRTSTRVDAYLLTLDELRRLEAALAPTSPHQARRPIQPSELPPSPDSTTAEA